MSANFVKYAVVTLILSLCVACGGIKKTKEIVYDRKNDYQAEQAAPRLKMPEHISAAKISDFYEVPETKEHLPSPDAELVPPGAKRWEVEKQTGKGQSLKSLIPKRRSQPKPVTDVPLDTVDVKTKQYQTLPGLQKFSADMPTMTVDNDFNAVWGSMDEALRVARYPVVGKVEDLKRFFIVDARGESGIFRRATPIYQLNFIPMNGTTILYVTDNDGKQLTNYTSARVLRDVNLGFQGKRKVSLWRWFLDS